MRLRSQQLFIFFSKFFIFDYNDRESLKNHVKSCFLNHLKIYQAISNNMCFKLMFGLLMTL